MSRLGQVRIGHKAPDFHCEAVIGGAIKEVSLSTFIRPSTSLGTPDPDAPWLLLLFIPAAFSFVCPTEVIAFQNCYDEFRDRHCSIAFVSVDTKHSLWHWQNVPRQYGGLGDIDIPLLSDATHKIGRDYGVLIEEEGVSLRGMFIIDGEGLVQQITLNNLTVGRSVLEALRLLEAFQAVAKHGVLCPIDWKPNSHASDTLNTISNTLVESYEDRLANLQKEFGDVHVTDLDAKYRSNANVESVPHAEFVDTPGPKVNIILETPNNPSGEEDSDARDPPPSPGHTSCTPRVSSTPHGEDPIDLESCQSERSQPPSPITAVATPATTPGTGDAPPLKLHSQDRDVRNTRGHTNTHEIEQAHSAPPKRPTQLGPDPNTFESRKGTHVRLEFADLLGTPMVSPRVESVPKPAPTARRHASTPPPILSAKSSPHAPSFSRATSWSGAPGSQPSSPSAGQTRLQATFQAIKSLSAGLTSPRLVLTPSKQTDKNGPGQGYFDVEGESEP